MQSRIVEVAQRLRGEGVRSGDRVLILGENSLSYVTILLAAMHLDASVVLIDAQQPAQELMTAAEVANVRWIIGRSNEDQKWPDIAQVISNTGLVDFIKLDPKRTGKLDITSWLRRSDAVVLWSSGTSGKPKGVVKSGPAILANTNDTVSAMSYQAGDSLMPLVPFSHQYGLSVVLAWWQVRCRLLIVPYWSLHTALAEVAEFSPTAIDATPSTYYMILELISQRPKLAETFRKVRAWGVGGAPLSAELSARFSNRMGQPLLDGYGMTELGNVSLATPFNPVSAGQPLPGVRVRIVDDNDLDRLAGQAGHILVSTPGRMEGYLNESGEVMFASGEWYRTEDLGFLDAAGNLQVIGRLNAVHRMGHTIHISSLEQRADKIGCRMHMVEIDDARRGVLLVAYIADPQMGDTGSWRRRLRTVLADFEMPNTIYVLPRFPINGRGKVDRDQLKASVPSTMVGR